MPHKLTTHLELQLQDTEDACLWAEASAYSHGHLLEPWNRKLARLGIASTTCRHCGTKITVETLDGGASWTHGGEDECPGGGSDLTGLFRAFIKVLLIGGAYLAYLYATNQ
jgi:hypothetical protein